MRRLAGSHELLLFIDQFEELYAAVDEGLRHRFGLFVHRLADTEGLRVVLTHRAVDRLQYFARRYRYVLRLDIVKHSASAASYAAKKHPL